VFEFEQVVRRVFQKERAVFDTGTRKSYARLLIERESLGFGPIRQRLPFALGKKDRTEVARVNTLLRRLIDPIT
jgi:hypothetical protein